MSQYIPCHPGLLVDFMEQDQLKIFTKLGPDEYVALNTKKGLENQIFREILQLSFRHLWLHVDQAELLLKKLKDLIESSSFNVRPELLALYLNLKRSLPPSEEMDKVCAHSLANSNFALAPLFQKEKFLIADLNQILVSAIAIRLASYFEWCSDESKKKLAQAMLSCRTSLSEEHRNQLFVAKLLGYQLQTSEIRESSEHDAQALSSQGFSKDYIDIGKKQYLFYQHGWFQLDLPEKAVVCSTMGLLVNVSDWLALKTFVSGHPLELPSEQREELKLQLAKTFSPRIFDAVEFFLRDFKGA